jgi:hypothetical protein
MKPRRLLILAVLIGLVPLLTGCGLADRSGTPPAPAAPQAANPGETQGTIPPDAREPAPAAPAATPQAAILRFAGLYINWSYRTLAQHEKQLAAISVGDARLAESQAAASTQRDSTLASARIYNRGTVITVAPVIGGQPGEYAVITREETGGDQEYAGLQAAFHVTLAAVQRVADGWSVREWQPQS